MIKLDGDSHRLWSRQPGTSEFDTSTGGNVPNGGGVATDGDGNVYVAGYTFGTLGGRNKGGADTWVIKFAADGHRLWEQQPGTSDGEVTLGVATDGNSNVYVVGYTLPFQGPPTHLCSR